MGRRRRTKVQRIINIIRRVIAFFFSHVGLCALVIAYSMFGAVVFQAIEVPHEHSVQLGIVGRRRAVMEEMWQAARDVNDLDRPDFTDRLRNQSRVFRRELMSAVRAGYDGKDSPEHPQWTMSGAFLYSLTVITTIGYGQVAPRTYFGKLITIVYAIIGIPLMLLFLTNVGDILAKTFRYLYSKASKLNLRAICCGKRSSSAAGSLKRQGSLTSSRSRQSAGKPSAYSLPARPNPQTKNHSGTYSAGRTMRPDQSFDSLEGAGAEIITMDDIRMESYGHEPPEEPPSLKGSCRQDSEQERYEQIAVPIHIILLVMALYFVAGAALFCFWENWPFLDGIYFCYISLTTIGFGDLMPGNSIKGDDGQTQVKLVICSLYLLFGMALIAMCFNLAQEEVVNKVTKVAKKLGMIKQEEDEEYA